MATGLFVNPALSATEVRHIMEQGTAAVSKAIKALQIQAASAEIDSSAIKETVACLENENECLRVELNQLQEQGKVNEEQITMLQQELVAIDQDVEDLRTQFQAEAMEITTVTKRVDLLEASVKSLQGVVGEAEEEKSQLRVFLGESRQAIVAAAACAKAAAARAETIATSLKRELAEVPDSLLLRQAMYTLRDRIIVSLQPRCADKEAATVKEIVEAGLEGEEDIEAAIKAALPGLTLPSKHLLSVFSEVLHGGKADAHHAVLPQHRQQLVSAAQEYQHMMRQRIEQLIEIYFRL